VSLKHDLSDPAIVPSLALSLSLQMTMQGVPLSTQAMTYATCIAMVMQGSTQEDFDMLVDCMRTIRKSTANPPEEVQKLLDQIRQEIQAKKSSGLDKVEPQWVADEAEG